MNLRFVLELEYRYALRGPRRSMPCQMEMQHPLTLSTRRRADDKALAMGAALKLAARGAPAAAVGRKPHRSRA